ncbi:MAG: hypothetical protein BGO92_09760 [Magnetospirillum sp. 64-120]|nr:MAG: hypothetical protein BGO92_09760 [Magnetospirillum sp. 64-120]
MAHVKVLCLVNLSTCKISSPNRIEAGKANLAPFEPSHSIDLDSKCILQLGTQPPIFSDVMVAKHDNRILTTNVVQKFKKVANSIQVDIIWRVHEIPCHYRENRGRLSKIS